MCIDCSLAEQPNKTEKSIETVDHTKFEDIDQSSEFKNKSGSKIDSWPFYLAVCSGLIFLILILLIAVILRDPLPEFNQFLIRVVLSVAAAGFGAAIPGFLELDLPLWQKGMLHAGGALSLFAIIYLINPPGIKNSNDINGNSNTSKKKNDDNLEEGDIEFQNRQIEIDKVTDVYCPEHLLINSPMGYGKSKLLTRAISILTEKTWYCIYVCLDDKDTQYTIKDISNIIFNKIGISEKDYDNLTNAESFGIHASRYIKQVLDAKKINNCALILDSAEYLSQEMAEQFSAFFLTIKNQFKIYDNSHRLRLIVSGRYISSRWLNYNLPISYGNIDLTPFDFSVVRNTVECFYNNCNTNGETISFNHKQDFASHLMFFTGGHPKCMSKILINDCRLPINIVTSKKQNYYNDIVKPVVDNIIKNINDDLKDIFYKISPIRCFNTQMLKYFIDKELILWEGSEYLLEDTFNQSYLVVKMDGFLRDDITRRLLVIYLIETDLECFLKVCENAIQFYKLRLNDPYSNRPDIIAVELLFQLLQYNHYVNNNAKETIKETLPEIFSCFKMRSEPNELYGTFLYILKNDWEFIFTYNYLLKEEMYNENQPFNQLLKNIERLIDDNDEVKE